MEQSEENLEGSFQPWRMRLVYVIIGLVFAFYLYRLFSIQIIDYQIYANQADENRTTNISIQTQRGIIYDRNGFVLARNVPSYSVSIIPADLPSDYGAVQEVFRELTKLIDVRMLGVEITYGMMDDVVVKNFTPCKSDLAIEEIVYIGETNAPYDPVKIKCNIDEKTAMIIREREKDLPGVVIEVDAVREYPTGQLTSEIIGFLGPIPASMVKEYEARGFVASRDKVGFAGIEMSMNDELSGTNGSRVVEVDSAGQILRDLETPVSAIPGYNLELTLDTRLQSAAKASFLNNIAYWNDRYPQYGLSNGVVIAMNPKNGEILAMASIPSYENNRFAKQIDSDYYIQLQEDPQNPLINHAISGEYAPGSVFKMAAALGILNEGVVTPDETLNDPGRITIVEKYSPNDPGTNRDYVCWEDFGHGNVDYLHGIAYSCDVYFYKVGGGYKDEVPEGLGIWRLGEYARALGYAATTGIDLPGETDGLIPDPDWKRINVGENWSTGDTYISTIGQGYVLATPLQVLLSFATLANDGKMMRPHVVKSIKDAEGNLIKEIEPELVRDITVDPVISVYDENYFKTEETKTVEPWVIELAKQGMRLVVTDGTSKDQFAGFEINTAGKTGTAEYCDDVAQKKGICKEGAWPAHAWYVGYAPYDDPEIVVVAFVYNGQEGSTVAAPIVRDVMQAYFDLKKADAANPSTGGQ